MVPISARDYEWSALCSPQGSVNMMRGDGGRGGGVSEYSQGDTDSTERLTVPHPTFSPWFILFLVFSLSTKFFAVPSWCFFAFLPVSTSPLLPCGRKTTTKPLSVPDTYFSLEGDAASIASDRAMHPSRFASCISSERSIHSL